VFDEHYDAFTVQVLSVIVAMAISCAEFMNNLPYQLVITGKKAFLLGGTQFHRAFSSTNRKSKTKANDNDDGKKGER
jgi:hypothetical protein